MNTKLDQIQDWPELARTANWSVSKLAKSCRVSRTTLRRHFLQHFAKTPKVWLAERRQQRPILGLLKTSANPFCKDIK